jgi:hypothetical protein
MTTLTRLTTLSLIVVLTACAHPISIAPDLSKLDAPNTPAWSRTIGYHLPAGEKALQVTTPGGGGDSVSYYPYRDIEGGLYKVLSNTFDRVVLVSDPKDVAALARDNVTLVVRPKITTQSSSDSVITWPPTFFQVQLSCTFTDVLGSSIAEVFVNGVGRAEFAEFSSDFSLAAKRASLDALQKAQRAIGNDTKFK